MNSKKIIIGLASCCAFLCACSSNTDETRSQAASGYSIEGKGIYLRGEMNDYEVSESYRLRSDGDNGYCTLANLRSDWAPYKFKFADESWSDGANFGYMAPPGVLREGSKAIEANPFSKFEEMSFYPKTDGVYRFCLIKDSSKYYVTVEKTSHHGLLSMTQLFKVSKKTMSN